MPDTPHTLIVVSARTQVAFPTGKLSAPGTRDLDFVDDLLAMIRRDQIPAPSPIEQRWTAGTASVMSPAAGAPDDVFSWVGIIMYLPDDPQQRAAITDR